MILIDTSQLVIASALNDSGYSAKSSDDENKNMIKHIFYNTIRSYRKKFGHQYGEIAFAIDSRKYWRKEFFPHYKFKRAKKREDSDINWELIFQIKDELKQELHDYFPYHVIEADGAEADDVLAVMSKNIHERHLIVASDHDSGQLQSDTVDQYCPRKKKILKNDVSVERLVFLHILKGDTGDGICNIKSPNDSFVTGTRQKPITEKFIEECWGNGIPEEFEQRFKENELLVNLNMIPDHIVKRILDNWHNRPQKDRTKVFNFFLENGYKLLLKDVGDF